MATATVAAPEAAEAVLAVRHPAMFRAHPVSFVGLCVLAIGGPAVAVTYGTIPLPARFGIGALSFAPLAVWWLRCWSVTLTVTSHRTRLRRGIIARYETEVRHKDVRNVVVDQTAWQRLWGIGSLGISSSGQSGFEINVDGVIGPARLKTLILERTGR